LVRKESAPSSSNGVERGGKNLDVSPISENSEKDILTKGRISLGFLGAAT
jgi:hypothetical protein